MGKSTRRHWMGSSAAAGLGFAAPAVARAAAASADLKITRAEVFHVIIPYAAHVRENMLENYRRENANRPHYETWIVRLQAGGLVGIGEGGQQAPGGVAALVGRGVWSLLHSPAAGPAAMIAVYDLAAKAAGIPVSRLFAPAPRAYIRQIWWSHSFRPKLMQAEARRGIELGYTVQKIKARPYEDTAEQVAAIAEVAPHDYTILADANGSFVTPEATFAVARALKRWFQVKGLEQPIAHEDIVGYRRIRRELPMRLAVHWEGVDARSFMLESLVDAFVVEDWQWGPALVQKSALCQFTGQQLWVENGLHTGISQVFQAHMAAALPNVEHTISLTHIGEDDLVNEPFVVAKGGLYKVPTGPGLGVTLDEKALDKYRAA